MIVMKPKKLIVFDMDGVIIDVSNSYRDVVRQTTRQFFAPAQAAEHLPDPLFELSDLAAVKQSGGLNNDWDLTSVVISLLYSLTDKPMVHKSENPWIRYRETISCCDVTVIAEYLNTTVQPLASLLKDKGKPEDNFISELYGGDVGSGNIIKQIFQEIYLGPELFKSTYQIEPEIYRGEGYILRERLLLDRSILEELSRENVLAIATGRPRSEAEYPLKHFRLGQFFPVVLTLDDCVREEKRIFEEEGRAVSLSKPDPFMLDAIAEGHRNDIDGFFYIGDMPDDMQAAARSRFGFKSIGLLISAPDKSSLKKNLLRAGADYIIEDFESLKKFIL
ncbi:MAG: HAD hydrolase-like protein [Deltaproteobacteria bacterium]|nr:HAD hydrolase-like protein [Deltaproteobacteria bacterium]